MFTVSAQRAIIAAAIGVSELDIVDATEMLSSKGIPLTVTAVREYMYR